MFIAMKPLVWNPDGYRRPSGNRRVGDRIYTELNGYGHEEWNGSPALVTTIGGERYRCFHTEPVQGALDHPGATVLFMYASHDGIQQLVGVAARVTSIAADAAAREKIRRQLSKVFDRMAREAWATPGVRERMVTHSNFLKNWGPNVSYMPTWIAPEKSYLWLEEPVTIDAPSLADKSKFLTMFGRYEQIDIAMAGKLMKCIPQKERNEAWRNITDALFDRGESVDDDISAILSSKAASQTVTTRKALIDARLGQGKFREDVLRHWGNACAVTGISTPAALRASHVLAWSDCTKGSHRLDPNNGIPLVATLDALFDKHLISFDSQGRMLISKSIDHAERSRLGLGGRLRVTLNGQAKAYLKHHQANHLQREAALA